MVIIKRKCGICKTPFKLKHPHQKYCSPRCQLIAQKRTIRRKEKKRNQNPTRKEYMAQYMFQWRRNYRKSTLNTDNRVRGTDTPPINLIEIEEETEESKMVVNSIL